MLVYIGDSGMKIFWYRPYADSTKLNFWKFSDINLPTIGRLISENFVSCAPWCILSVNIVLAIQNMNYTLFLSRYKKV